MMMMDSMVGAWSKGEWVKEMKDSMVGGARKSGGESFNITK